MKKTICTLALFLICLLSLNAQNISFEQAWRSVYRLENDGLTKSAWVKVDSIYAVAKRGNYQKEFFRASIYQNKYQLLLEENAQQKVLERLDSLIATSDEPYKRLYHYLKAKSLKDYLERNTYKINSNDLEETDTTDFNFWGEEQFLNQIHHEFQKALAGSSDIKLDNKLLADLFEYPSWDAYDFLSLKDWITAEAIDFYLNSNGRSYTDFYESYFRKFLDWKEFSQIDFTPSDSFNKANGFYLLQQHSSASRNSGNKNLATYWELMRLQILEDISYGEEVEKFIESYRNLLQDDNLEKDLIKIKLAQLLVAIDEEKSSMYDFENKHSINDNLLEEAHLLATEVLETSTESFEATQAKKLIQKIERTELELKQQAFVPKNTYSRFLLTFRNLRRINLKLYKVDKGQIDFLSRSYSQSNIDSLLNKIDVFSAKAYDLPETHDYQLHSTEILVDPLPPGQYALAVFNNEENELSAISNFQVTNLSLLDIGSETQNQFLIADRLSGEGLANAEVTFSLRKGEETVFKTDNNGRIMVNGGSNNYNNTARVVYAGDTAYFGNINLYYNRYYDGDEEELYDVMSQIFTDRSIYRPGQTVYFKGLLTKRKGAERGIVANEQVLVSIYDANDETIYEEYHITNEFGSYSDSLKIPTNTLTGEFTIEVEEGDRPSDFFEYRTDNFNDGWETFSVENYKRPKFEVTANAIDSAYVFGDSVSFSGKATAFAGNSISGAKVKYAVHQKGYRTAPDPAAYYWENNWHNDEKLVQEGELTVDSDGAFTITFPTSLQDSVNKAKSPVYEYEASFTVTDLNGESHELTKTIMVGFHSANITLMLEQPVVKSDGSLTLNIISNNLNGEPTTTEGKLEIFRLDFNQAFLFERAWDAPDMPLMSQETFEEYFPNEPFDERLLVPDTTLIFIKAVSLSEAKVTVEEINDWKSAKYYARYTPSSKSEKQVTTTFDLLENLEERLTPSFINITADKTAYKVGENANLTVASGAEEVTVYVLPTRRKGPKKEYVFHLKNRKRTIRIPIEEYDLGGFKFHYMAVGTNHAETGSLSINVPEPTTELNIETSSFRSLLEAGEQETWNFNITGAKKENVEAEVLASMYDASLDQFVPHNWRVIPMAIGGYNVYSRFSVSSSFRQINGQSLLYNYYPNITFKRKPAFEAFGYSFTDPKSAQSNYLTTYITSRKSHLISRVDTSIPKGKIQGVVRDEFGAELPGAAVIEDANNVVPTNRKGEFSINAEEGDVLIFRFLGYKSVQVKIAKDNYLDIMLSPDTQKLSEVVVVGYGKQEKKSLTSSVLLMEVADEESLDIVFEEEPETLQVQVAGVNWSPSNSSNLTIRGASSLSAANQPLFVVDGVVVDASQLSPDEIADMSMLKGSAATSIYGARAANGVVIITSKKAATKQKELLDAVPARTNFRETAFFYPHLKTDAKGNVNFSFETPESLTEWKLQLLAHTKKYETKKLVSTIQTRKKLMVVPNLPRFIRVGDSLLVSAKVVNMQDSAIRATAQFTATDPFTNQPIELLSQQDQPVKQTDIAANSSVEVQWKIAVPEGLNGIQYRVVAATDNFSDGEENYLPVLPQKILVTESMPIWAAAADSSFTFELPALLNKPANVTDVSLKFELTKNPVWNVIQSLPYLIEFPFECSEQTFARIFANALGNKILKEHPQLETLVGDWSKLETQETPLTRNATLKQLALEETPWLKEAQSAAERKASIARLINYDSLNENLNEAIKSLKEMQMSNGAFPWFKGGRFPNRTITTHIVSGLGQMRSLGFSLDSLGLEELAYKGLSYLDEAFISGYNRDSRDSTSTYLNPTTIYYLYARSYFMEVVPTAELQIALDYYLGLLERKWNDQSLQLKAMSALVFKRFDKNTLAKKLIRSLDENATFSEERGMYWLENESNGGWFSAQIETHAIIMEAFEEISPELNRSKLLNQWLLQHKRVNAWPTTKATTLAIYAVLQNTNSSEPAQLRSIKVGSENIDTSSSTSDLFIENTWHTDEISAELGGVEISKMDDTPVWGALHYQFLQNSDEIARQGGALQVGKRLYLIEQNGDQKEVTPSTNLKVGDKVRVQLLISIDRDMDFIHLKDRRSASFEPLDVLSGHQRLGNVWAYQSTKDASTHFFFDELSKGQHQLSYDVVINNAGTFSGAPATIESMYSPEFNARSKGGILKVIKQ